MAIPVFTRPFHSCRTPGSESELPSYPGSHLIWTRECSGCERGLELAFGMMQSAAGAVISNGKWKMEIFIFQPGTWRISQSGCGLPAFHGGCPHQRHREPRRQARRLCLEASLTMSLTDQPSESCEPLRKNKSV